MTVRQMRTWASIFLGAGLLATACGGPTASGATIAATSDGAESAPAGGSSDSAFGADHFTAPANPLDLTLTTDAARAVTVHMTPAGGTVLTTGADGTTFALEVPAEALVEEIDITLTPVASIEGWDVAPDGSVAVLMEPDGLEFATPARLVITPTAAIGDVPGSPFAFYADGRDAYLTARDGSGSEIVVAVEHFSGNGFTWSVSEPFWTAWTRHRQQQTEDRLRHRLAVQVGLRAALERMGMFVGAYPPIDRVFEEVRNEFERDVLNARLLLASNSCKDALHAMAGFSAWNRQMQILGRPDLEIQPPRKLRLTARYVCAEENTELCFETGDLERLVSELLADERQNQRAAEGLPNDLGAYAKACGQYDLEIEQHSEGLIGDAFGWDMEAEIEITIPLRWVAEDPAGLVGKLEGEKIGQVVDASGVAGPCTITLKIGPGDRAYKGTITSLDFIRTGPNQDTARFRDLTLEFTEGHAGLPGTMKCPKVPAFNMGSIEMPFAFHGDPPFVIDGWDADGHPTIATKDKSRVIAVGSVGTEDLHLELVHTPGEMPVRPNIP